MYDCDSSYKKGILKVIEKFSYNFYLIHPNKEINCKCINFDTKEPDVKCPHCLGTGNRITIKNIRGAHQETAIPTTARDLKDITMARVYYIPYDHKIERKDLIIDDDDAFFVYAVQNEVGFHGEKIYQKCLAYSKKLESVILIKNFNKIMGDNHVKSKTIKR